MEPRLFDIDFQLLHDFILFIIAFGIPLLIFIVCILVLIINSRKKKRNCSNCPYNNIESYH